MSSPTYPIDSTKLALMGYSYGGEMAGFVEGKTDRFKAIISGAPVIDQFSEYGTEGGSWYDRWYFGKPWEHMNDAWRQSPLAGVAHAKTPFLLLAGRERYHRSAWPGAGNVSRSPSGRRPRRTRHLSAREPRPARHRHARPPLAEPWHGFDARQRIVNFITAAFSPTPPPSTAPANSKGR